jgi:tetratricopeptide (TPR) repeat protein
LGLVPTLGYDAAKTEEEKMLWKVGLTLLLSIALTAAEPKNVEFDWVALHLRVMGLLQQRKVAESERLLDESIHAARLRGETSNGLARALNDLGSLFQDEGRLREADRVYREALAQLTRLPGGILPMGVTLGNVANLRLAEGKPSEAEKLYLDARRILSNGDRTQSPELAVVLCGLADVYWETRRYADATRAAQTALDMLRGPGHDSQVGVALFLLGKIAISQHREADAEELVRRAVELWRISLGPDHPTYVSGLATLAIVLATENPSEAVRVFDDALQTLEKYLGAEHMWTGYALLAFANHLETFGRKKEGKELKRRGEAILARHFRENLLGQTLDLKAYAK